MLVSGGAAHAASASRFGFESKLDGCGLLAECLRSSKLSAMSR